MALDAQTDWCDSYYIILLGLLPLILFKSVLVWQLFSPVPPTEGAFKFAAKINCQYFHAIIPKLNRSLEMRQKWEKWSAANYNISGGHCRHMRLTRSGNLPTKHWYFWWRHTSKSKLTLVSCNWFFHHCLTRHLMQQFYVKMLEFPIVRVASLLTSFCHFSFLKSHRFAFLKKRMRLFGFKSQLNMSVELFSTYSKKTVIIFIFYQFYCSFPITIYPSYFSSSPPQHHPQLPK